MTPKQAIEFSRTARELGMTISSFAGDDDPAGKIIEEAWDLLDEAANLLEYASSQIEGMG